MTTTQTPENTDAITELTTLDRCDSCGAQAYVRVRLQSGGELYFCGHHATEAKPSLEPLVSEWHDETSKISADSPE